MTQGASSFKAQSTFSCFHRKKTFYGKNERGTDHYPNLLLNKKNLFKIDLGLELARLWEKETFLLYTYSLSVLDDGASKKFSPYYTMPPKEGKRGTLNERRRITGQE